MINFKKYFYKILCCFCLSSVAVASPQEEGELSFTQTTPKSLGRSIEALRKIYPEEGKDLEKIDYALSHKVHELLKQSQDNPSSVFMSSQPIFKIIMEDYIKYMKPFSRHNKAVENIVQQLENDQAEEQYVWARIMQAVFNFATAISTPSLEEKDLFAHVVTSSLYQAFAENIGKEPLSERADILKYYMKWEKNKLPPESIIFPENKIENAYFLLESNTPHINNNFVLPVLGTGKIDLLSLNFLNLINVPVLGLPSLDSSDRSAHGVFHMSPLGFLVHDVAHNLIDASYKKGAFAYHYVKLANQALERGVPAPQFMKEYAPLALQRYKGILSLFQSILEEMIQETALSQNITHFRQSMVGLFYILHESLGWKEEMYEEDSAIKIVSRVTEEGIKGVSQDVFVSIDDSLNTSPTNGESAFTDDEIIENYIVREKIDEFNKDNICQYSIKRTEFFINTTVVLKNNKTLSFSHPTLYFKKRNMEDMIGLLKYGGINIEMPSSDLLLSRAIQQNIVKDTLSQVQELLKGQINIFSEKAKRILSSKQNESSRSIEEDFALWSQSLRTKTENLMTPEPQKSA